MSADQTAPVLEARDLSVTFPPRRGHGAARAVDGVNLTLGRGEVLALIGESGCGKSTLARALVGLIPPDEGEIRYDGKPLERSKAGLRDFRRKVQLVLQDPAGALSPRQNVHDAVAEGFACTVSAPASPARSRGHSSRRECVRRRSSSTASRTSSRVVNSNAW